MLISRYQRHKQRSQPSSSRSPVASATNTPAPVKSFKEAFTSPARLPASSFDCNTSGKRLAEVELSLKEHKQKIRELDRKAETLDRQAKELNLNVYDVPETAGKDSQDAAALDSLFIKCMPNCDDVDWTMQRLGKYCLDQKRSQPVSMVFNINNNKHTFLEHAKHLQEAGVRYDDHLTRLQQSERQDLSADFNILNTRGHKPFYRGCSLNFCHADKTRTCKRNGANTAPVAQA